VTWNRVNSMANGGGGREQRRGVAFLKRGEGRWAGDGGDAGAAPVMRMQPRLARLRCYLLLATTRHPCAILLFCWREVKNNIRYSRGNDISILLARLATAACMTALATRRNRMKASAKPGERGWATT